MNSGQICEFKLRGLGVVWGLFMLSVSKESKIGVFKHLKSSPKPFERIFGLESSYGDDGLLEDEYGIRSWTSSAWIDASNILKSENNHKHISTILSRK